MDTFAQNSRRGPAGSAAGDESDADHDQHRHADGNGEALYSMPLCAIFAK